MKWNDPAAFSLVSYRSPGFESRKLDRYADAASRLHPLIGDWLCSAPILAVALSDERYYQGLFDLAQSRGKVVDALRVCNLPTPMRKQTAAEVDQWFRFKGWVDAFPEVNPSELSQLLSNIRGPERREWQSRLTTVLRLRPAGVDCGDFARWAVRVTAKEPLSSIRLAIDFMGNNEFDLSWSIGRFQREHRAWVERLRAEYEAEQDELRARKALRLSEENKMLDQPVDLGPFAQMGHISGVAVTAIDTQRKLMAEGHRMHHCVGNYQYRSALRNGRALFFHLEVGKERSTLEVIRRKNRYLVGQHCGPCNQYPHPFLERAAQELIASAKQVVDGFLST